jgi:hypothetical protein
MANGAQTTIEVNQVTDRLVGAIVLVLGLAGTLVGVTVWLTNLSHRADAGATLQQSVVELGDKMEHLSGQMEMVVSTRDDVTKLRSDLDSLRDRHTELFTILETNRAYTNQLAGLMRERGITVPPPPPTPRPRE